MERAAPGFRVITPARSPTIALAPRSLPNRCFVEISQIDAALTKTVPTLRLSPHARRRLASRLLPTTRERRACREGAAALYSHSANSASVIGSRNSGPTLTTPLSAPNWRLAGSPWMGVNRAIGVLPRAMTISSPASTLARSLERFVFASWMVTVDIESPRLTRMLANAFAPVHRPCEQSAKHGCVAPCRSP
jgi:hypothetical protein